MRNIALFKVKHYKNTSYMAKIVAASRLCLWVAPKKGYRRQKFSPLRGLGLTKNAIFSPLRGSCDADLVEPHKSLGSLRH